MTKLNVLICAECHKVFCDPNENKKLCPDCKSARERKKHKQARKPEKSFYQILKEVESYNKKHGTMLSYGQYVGLVDNQK